MYVFLLAPNLVQEVSFGGYFQLLMSRWVDITSASRYRNHEPPTCNTWNRIIICYFIIIMNIEIEYFEVLDEPRSRERGTGLVGLLASTFASQNKYNYYLFN